MTDELRFGDDGPAVDRDSRGSLRSVETAVAAVDERAIAHRLRSRYR